MKTSHGGAHRSVASSEMIFTIPSEEPVARARELAANGNVPTEYFTPASFSSSSDLPHVAIWQGARRVRDRADLEDEPRGPHLGERVHNAGDHVVVDVAGKARDHLDASDALRARTHDGGDDGFFPWRARQRGDCTSSSALCASIGPSITSPIAKMDGIFVLKCESTTTRPSLSVSMPISSRPRPSVKGLRPARETGARGRVDWIARRDREHERQRG